MKKIISYILIIILFVTAPIGIVAGLFYGIPNQYTETYVGVLEDMFNRLNLINEPKVIVVGGSNVAFGLRSDLMEQELGMPCVNFGLYGTIGTKTMMDLSKSNINEGDMVILATETTHQAMSMYFNPDAMLRALNGNNEMLSYIPADNRLEMLNELPGYISTNFDVYTGKSKVSLEGVYQHSSFNEYCDISYSRPYNIMLDLYDSVAPVKFSIDEIDSEFIDYVNDYASYVRNAGASIYFSYSPINALAVSDEGDIAEYENYLREKLNMDIISNVSDYIMDAQLFYDTNFHCNDVGAIYRTNQLICDIRRFYGDNSAPDIVLPDIPVAPPAPTEPDYSDDGVEQNNDDAACFSYEMVGTTYAISGLTDEGRKSETLTIPYSYEGVKITRILSNAFENATMLKSVTVQTNINQIQNNVFEGCDNLVSIYILHTDPRHITVGMAGGLLDGANDDCMIYVPNDSLSLFINDYNWEAYLGRLRGH